ncbi:MAG TPA: Hpt domain-containing protein, partial [Azonexus sp.]|nr:Hpt domain-containing protein [Azonexus sp.]
RFIDDHAGDMAKLVDSLDKGDRDSSRRLAHSLKGAAATLAAEPLAEAARTLDSRLRQEGDVRSDDVRAEIASVNDEFSALADAVAGDRRAPPQRENRL